MKRVLGAAMAVGIGIGAVSGCGGPEVVEQPAAIEGFAYGVNSQLWDKKWTQYTEEEYIPSGEIRNVRHQEIFDRCIVVDDEDYSFNEDYIECSFDYSFDRCNPGDYEHCEAVYEDRWDYEQLEDYIVQQCMAPLTKMEYKPREPKTNELCDKSRKGLSGLPEKMYLLYR